MRGDASADTTGGGSTVLLRVTAPRVALVAVSLAMLSLAMSLGGATPASARSRLPVTGGTDDVGAGGPWSSPPSSPTSSETTLPETTLPATTLPVTTLPVTTLPVTTLPAPSDPGWSGAGPVAASDPASDPGGGSPDARHLPVSVGSLAVSDAGRSTPARGSVPGHPGRDLPTTVWYPSAAGPWPLVVFAHGYNTTPAAYTALTSFLASEGYIVAAPAMPGARSDAPGTPTRTDIPDEPRDLSRVLDAVLMAGGTSSSFLYGRVDGSRVGSVGHSDGGIAVAAMAMNSATVDTRLRASAVLSGARWSIPGGTWGSVQAGSVLVAHGTEDPIEPYSSGATVYAAARAPKALLAAVGGGHQTPYTGTGAQPDAMRASIADFLDLQLRGDLAGVSRLYTDANQPGLTQLVSADGISANPTGFFDSVTRVGNQSVRVVGWTIDPDTDAAVAVTLTVDGREALTTPADVIRDELPFFFPSFSAGHGFDTNLSVGPGHHSVCAQARNAGHGTSDTALGCRSITVFPQVVGGPAVANFDGRLEVFAVQPDGSPRHTFQRWPGGAWDQWYPLGDIALTGSVATATNDDGRLEVFGVGTDGQIWHTWQVCPGCWWSGWYPLHGGSWRADRVSVAANGDGRLEVFAVATDGTLQHIWQPAPRSGWSGWYSLQAPWTSSPSTEVAGVVAGRQADGRLVTASVDPSGHLVVVVQAGPGVGWGGWQVLGGSIAGAPVLGVDQDLRLEAFAVGTNGLLWHAFQWGAGWSSASSLAASLDPRAGIATVNQQDQRLTVFGSMPTDHAVAELTQSAPNSGWNGPAPVGGAGTSLAAGANPDGRVELFAMTAPVTHAYQVAPNSSWSPWYVL